MTAFLRLLEYARPYRGRLTGAVVAMIVYGFASAGIAYLIKPITDKVLVNGMLAAGLVEESGERPDAALDDERRRYYRMTELGRRTVRAEAQRLAGAVTVAMAKLAGDHA